MTIKPKNFTPINPTALDRAIGYFSPRMFNSRMSQKIKTQMSQQIGYVTPGSAKKTMRGVVASANSPDFDTAPKIQGSRALSREMVMNSPLAVAAIKRARTSVVGSGLVPKPVVDWEYLGITEEQARDTEAQMLREFMAWADSPNCDSTRTQNFWDKQATAFLSTFTNGDTFFMLPWRKVKNAGNWPYELRIKLIEADLVSNPPNITELYDLGGKDVVSGIRHNKHKEAISAFFSNHYPNNLSRTLDYSGKWKEIKKFSRSGRQNWFQLFEPERIGQRRGMPFLAPVLDMLKSLSRLSDSELTAALVASLFTVFIKDQSGLGNTLNEPFQPTDTVAGGGTTTDGEGNQTQHTKNIDEGTDLELGSGMIHYLDDDKDITIADPKRPNDAFEPFFNALVTQIGAATEIPGELLLLKFNTSYSAARAALLEAWKFWQRRRTWLVREFCQPIYDAFLTEAVIKGRVSCPGFFDDVTIQRAWTNALWAGPGMGQLDPLKETRSALLKVGGQLSNHQKEYAESTGGHWDQAMQQKSREMKVLESLGLKTNLEPKELIGPDGVADEETEPTKGSETDTKKEEEKE